MAMSAAPLLEAEAAEQEGEAAEQCVCRVCLHAGVDATTGPLISPCLCDGSVRYVHRGCLERWAVAQSGFLSANTSVGEAQCELCGFHYHYESRPASLPEAASAVLRSSFWPMAQFLVLGSVTVYMVGLLKGATIVGTWLGMKACCALFRFLLTYYVLARNQRHLPEGPVSAATAASLLTVSNSRENPLLARAEEMRRLAREQEEEQDELEEAAEAQHSPAALGCCVVGTCFSLVTGLFLVAALLRQLILRLWLLVGFVRALCVMGAVYILFISVTAVALFRMPVVRSLTEEERQEAADERRERRPRRSRRARADRNDPPTLV